MSVKENISETKILQRNFTLSISLSFKYWKESFFYLNSLAINIKLSGNVSCITKNNSAVEISKSQK